MSSPRLDAVIFDMDGVLVDSEDVWDRVIGEFALDCGGTWHSEAQRATMGMCSRATSRYMHAVLGFDREPTEIEAELDRRIIECYQSQVPQIAGAVEAVQRLAAAGLRLAVASSSNRCLIDTVLAETGLAPYFPVTVSAQEVAQGKPAPDVYLEAVRRLGLEPRHCAAVEDSANGIRAAHAAGLRVIVLPHPVYPPTGDAVALADVVLGSFADLSPALARDMASSRSG